VGRSLAGLAWPGLQIGKATAAHRQKRGAFLIVDGDTASRNWDTQGYRLGQFRSDGSHRYVFAAMPTVRATQAAPPISTGEQRLAAKARAVGRSIRVHN
jgi:hypothetical protein